MRGHLEERFGANRARTLLRGFSSHASGTEAPVPAIFARRFRRLAPVNLRTLASGTLGGTSDIAV